MEQCSGPFGRFGFLGLTSVANYRMFRYATKADFDIPASDWSVGISWNAELTPDQRCL